MALLQMQTARKKPEDERDAVQMPPPPPPRADQMVSQVGNVPNVPAPPTGGGAAPATAPTPRPPQAQVSPMASGPRPASPLANTALANTPAAVPNVPPPTTTMETRTTGPVTEQNVAVTRNAAGANQGAPGGFDELGTFIRDPNSQLDGAAQMRQALMSDPSRFANEQDANNYRYATTGVTDFAADNMAKYGTYNPSLNQQGYYQRSDGGAIPSDWTPEQVQQFAGSRGITASGPDGQMFGALPTGGGAAPAMAGGAMASVPQIAEETNVDGPGINNDGSMNPTFGSVPQVPPPGGSDTFRMGLDSLKGELSQYRDDLTNSMMEEMAARGVVGGSPEEFARGRVAGRVQTAFNSGLSDLASQDRGFGLQERALDQSASQFDRGLALQQLQADRADFLGRRQLELTETGMDRDEAYRQASMEADDRYRQAVLSQNNSQFSADFNLRNQNQNWSQNYNQNVFDWQRDQGGFQNMLAAYELWRNALSSLSPAQLDQMGIDPSMFGQSNRPQVY